jgi:hypothetical protein
MIPTPRSLPALALAALALLAASPRTHASGTAFNGVLGSSCTAPWSAGQASAVIYGFKATSPDQPDVLFDESLIGGPSVGLARVNADGSWSLPPNWRTPLCSDDVVTAVVVAPGVLFLDSDSVGASGGDLGLTTGQVVGALRGRAPRVTPVAGGYRLEFAPVRELGTSVGGACDVAGCREHGRRLVVGYNVYRLPARDFPTPTLADFRLHGFLAHGDLGGFDDRVASRTGSESDLAQEDEWSLRNPDGLPATGDEIIAFDDLATRPDGSGRELAPDPEDAYWYRVQPVVAGRAAYFATGTVSSQRLRAGLVDQDGDGHAEGVDLLLDGIVEFVDPSGRGLGLAHDGEILSSPEPGLGAPPPRAVADEPRLGPSAGEPEPLPTARLAASAGRTGRRR